ncbi:hypothetical protein SCHPADRAFT_328778 [Schizopora paradoxa]|uniref:Uncharacterized protein n=1 Tax=Schizopora paradoxa TaxID=27342 RepID=A0A0H2SB54_9AGAM|nr:hypothetical protein SCHPADRAFT_328778 [Schizopora paradoxa]
MATSSIDGTPSSNVVEGHVTSPTFTTAIHDNVPATSPQRHEDSVFGVLSDDLLIFIWVQTISVETQSGFSPAYDPRALLKVSAVCKYWRRTALNASFLWAYIPSSLSIFLLRLFLIRSADAPLHVDMWCGNTPYVHPNWSTWSLEIFLTKFTTILHHSRRIRYLSLRIGVYTTTAIESGLTGADGRTPNLEGFCFQVIDTKKVSAPVGDVERRIADAKISIYGKFSSPRLRELSLGGLRIPPNSTHVASLSLLSLKFASVENSLGDYLTDILEDGTSLISLSLDLSHTNTIFPSLEPRSNRPHLPLLRRLSLKGSFRRCMELSAIFSTQTLEELHLSLDTRDSFIDADDTSQLLPSTPPGDSARVKIDGNSMHLELFDSRKRSPYGSQKGFRFTLDTQFSQETHYGALLGFLIPHRFPNVQSVDLHISDAIRFGLMQAIFLHFGTIRSLRIHIKRDSECIAPIEDYINLDLFRFPTSPLKSLQSLIFSNFTAVVPQAVAFILEIRAIDLERVKAGQPPVTLEFENCGGIEYALFLSRESGGQHNEVGVDGNAEL